MKLKERDELVEKLMKMQDLLCVEYKDSNLESRVMEDTAEFVKEISSLLQEIYKLNEQTLSFVCSPIVLTS